MRFLRRKSAAAQSELANPYEPSAALKDAMAGFERTSDVLADWNNPSVSNTTLREYPLGKFIVRYHREDYSFTMPENEPYSRHIVCFNPRDGDFEQADGEGTLLDTILGLITLKDIKEVYGKIRKDTPSYGKCGTGYRERVLAFDTGKEERVAPLEALVRTIIERHKGA